MMQLIKERVTLFFFFLIRLVYGCVQCRCSETRIFAKTIPKKHTDTN